MIIDSLQKNNKIIEIENKLNGLIDVFYPVGSYYETSDKNFNPNTSWGGTWEKDNSGVFLVSEDSSLKLGETGGEKTHQLTINEMPKHSHMVRCIGLAPNGSNISVPSIAEPTYQAPTGETGGNQYHNNMPPYLVVARWHRIS